MFGSNTRGQLGLGSKSNVNINKPTAVKEDGRLFMWGDNSVGQIGLGAESYTSEPREVMVGQPVAWVSCGYYHSAFVTVDGDLYTFGESGNGRLGLFPDQLANHRVPQQVEGIQDPVIQVSCGGEHTVALTKEDVYTFGRGQHGQLGHGTFLFEAPLPKALDHFRNGRVNSGILYTFGDGRHGKLGLGEENFTNQFRPTLCPRFLKYSVQSVAGGSSHMLVLAMPRPHEVEEVVIEEDDVTETILEALETYTELLLMDPSLLMPTPPTAPPLWTLSARARRRERSSPKKKPTPSKSPKSTSKEPISPSRSFKSMPKLIPAPTLTPKTPFKKPTDDNQSPKTLSKWHPSPSRSPTPPQTERTEDTVTEAPDSLMLIENMEDEKDTATDANKQMGFSLTPVPAAILPINIHTQHFLAP
ncbi:unnamed protein product [Coregonus sp. 'balchen']|nr:unnamed protein product [Coregonus sp. 'balchen']